MDPVLVAEFVTAFHAGVNQVQAETGNRRRVLERQLSDVKRTLDGLIDAIADGLRAPNLQDRLDDLEARRSTLTREVAQVDAPPIR
jgi:site-specific DNA recombinase